MVVEDEEQIRIILKKMKGKIYFFLIKNYVGKELLHGDIQDLKLVKKL
jgi:hypothetical protein